MHVPSRNYVGNRLMHSLVLVSDRVSILVSTQHLMLPQDLDKALNVLTRAYVVGLYQYGDMSISRPQCKLSSLKLQIKFVNTDTFYALNVGGCNVAPLCKQLYRKSLAKSGSMYVWYATRHLDGIAEVLLYFILKSVYSHISDAENWCWRIGHTQDHLLVLAWSVKYTLDISKFLMSSTCNWFRWWRMN